MTIKQGNKTDEWRIAKDRLVAGNAGHLRRRQRMLCRGGPVSFFLAGLTILCADSEACQQEVAEHVGVENL